MWRERGGEGEGVRRERECGGRESVEGERVRRERECGGRESVEGESGG